MLDSVTPQRPEKIRASSVAFKQLHQEQCVRTIFMDIRLSLCETKLGLKLLQCPVLLMLLVSFLSAQLARVCLLVGRRIPFSCDHGVKIMPCEAEIKL